MDRTGGTSYSMVACLSKLLIENRPDFILMSMQGNIKINAFRMTIN
jgi:hypothetical protein